MRKFLDLLVDSPGVVAQLVLAAIAVLVSFGLYVSDVQSGAIVALVMAASAVAASLVGREKTVPTDRVLKYKDREGRLHPPGDKLN